MDEKILEYMKTPEFEHDYSLYELRSAFDNYCNTVSAKDCPKCRFQTVCGEFCTALCKKEV